MFTRTQVFNEYLKSCEKLTPALITVFVVSLIMRIGLAWYDGNIATLPGADADSLSFHKKASELAEGTRYYKLEPGGHLYIHYLTHLYKMLIPHKTVGNLVSVLVSVIAMIYFLKILFVLKIDKWNWQIFALFAFQPSFLLYGSITLREAYQLLFIETALFYLLLFVGDTQTRKKFSTVVLFCLSLFLLSLLHNRVFILISYAIFFGSAGVVLLARNPGSQKLFFIGLSMITVLGIWWARGGHFTTRPVTSQEISPSALKSLGAYSSTVPAFDPGTRYPIGIDYSSIINFVLFAVAVLTLYLFYPFLIQIRKKFSTMVWFCLSLFPRNLGSQKLFFIGLSMIMFLGIWWFEEDLHSIIEKIKNYSEGVLKKKPRTGYPIGISDSGTISFLLSVVVVFLQYLFYPFLWNVTIWQDLLVVFECSMRLVLTISILWFSRSLQSKHLYTCLLFILFYLVCTMPWVLGSSTYGQGWRHHITTNWVLLVLAGFVYNRAHKPSLRRHLHDR